MNLKQKFKDGVEYFKAFTTVLSGVLQKFTSISTDLKSLQQSIQLWTYEMKLLNSTVRGGTRAESSISSFDFVLRMAQ